ncbi:hypothetical protein [Tahibacter caeni]|uniref:hypothetical protein n=1 Tax=Tahibacter caeni TaxID=1453545 RepID=UPI0021495765|nr:hypothetical protein [Tahibacter caeni]
MSYKKLYEFCQQQNIPVSRSVLIRKVKELTGKSALVVKSDLNPDLVRGFFLSANNKSIRIVQQAQGRAVIVLARQLNYCWERFVWSKELMHLFDDNAINNVSNAADFENLLEEFASPQLERSDMMDAEVRSFWMALGALCPEAKRQEFEALRRAGQITDLEIATRLRIPEHYVRTLFEQRFKENIRKLLDEN